MAGYMGQQNRRVGVFGLCYWKFIVKNSGALLRDEIAGGAQTRMILVDKT